MYRVGFALLLIALAGCQSAGPLRGGPVGPEAEALAGRRAARQLEGQFGPVKSDDAADRVLRPVSARIAASAATRAPECRILSSREVNAFSLPGGLVYLTQGLYDRIGTDDALLAATIAHELAHIAYKDSLKPACGSEQESLNREIAADAAGAGYLRAAGYSADDLIRLLAITGDVQPAGWAAARTQRLRQEAP